MRIAVFIAASVLVAGCATGCGGQDGESGSPSGSRLSVPSPTTRASAPPTTTLTSKPPVGAPVAGASIGDVIAFVAAGTPTDVGGFHEATRDGAVSELGEAVAFTTPSGTTRCMTGPQSDGGLDCLVRLTDPPPAPPDIAGQWIGDWVDFTGPTLDVGSVHGDPGPFVRGDGAALPYGRSLAFGDFRCRADPAGLFCVNFAHQTAARLSDAGVEPFGCLKRVSPPADVGIRFGCPE